MSARAAYHVGTCHHLTASLMNEFDAIRAFFNWPTPTTHLGVGDDAALCLPAAGQAWAVSTDMLVEGRHFFAGADARALGHKALAVNLSDMAAMGARPRHFTLSLALPSIDIDWLQAFSGGMRTLADTHGCELIGGDTTRGPLNICITVMGQVPETLALRRDTAQVGDDLYVSGRLGGARLGLWHRQGRLPEGLPADAIQQGLTAMDLPTPRVDLGLALRGIASAAMDLSDGLSGDVGHLAKASHCHAEIWLPQLPVAPAVLACMGDQSHPFAASGGDDYELLFCAHPQHRSALQALAVQLGVPLTRIGHMKAPGTLSEGVATFLDAHGEPCDTVAPGFDHFSHHL